MRDGKVSALVLIHRWPAEVARQLSEQWPSVSIIHEYPGGAIDHIGVNDNSGMNLLVEHLKAGGQKRIGFFGLCPEVSWSISRYGAYHGALAIHDYPFDANDVIRIGLADALKGHHFEPGEWMGKVLARMDAGVDAWVCPSGASANSLCELFLNRGIRMPEEVALTSYHRGAIRQPDLPEITSTMIQDEDLGAAALRRLMHRLDHPSEPQRSILLPVGFSQGVTTRRV